MLLPRHWKPSLRFSRTLGKDRAPFFLQKGPSWEISPRDISQFTPENAPYGKSIPPIAMGGQGALPLWIPRDFLKKNE